MAEPEKENCPLCGKLMGFDPREKEWICNSSAHGCLVYFKEGYKTYATQLKSENSKLDQKCIRLAGALEDIQLTLNVLNLIVPDGSGNPELIVEAVRKAAMELIELRKIANE